MLILVISNPSVIEPNCPDLFGHEQEFRYFYSSIPETDMNEAEKRVVGKMIAIYCRGRHGSGGPLCEECGRLLRYAEQRLEHCPFGEQKPTCESCSVHCYKKEMRQQIREVMRMAGPRMLLLHPFDTLRHFYRERQRNRKFAQRSESQKKETGETAQSQ